MLHISKIQVNIYIYMHIKVSAQVSICFNRPVRFSLVGARPTGQGPSPSNFLGCTAAVKLAPALVVLLRVWSSLSPWPYLVSFPCVGCLNCAPRTGEFWWMLFTLWFLLVLQHSSNSASPIPEAACQGTPGLVPPSEGLDTLAEEQVESDTPSPPKPPLKGSPVSQSSWSIFPYGGEQRPLEVWRMQEDCKGIFKFLCLLWQALVPGLGPQFCASIWQSGTASGFLVIAAGWLAWLGAKTQITKENRKSKETRQRKRKGEGGEQKRHWSWAVSTFYILVFIAYTTCVATYNSSRDITTISGTKSLPSCEEAAPDEGRARVAITAQPGENFEIPVRFGRRSGESPKCIRGSDAKGAHKKLQGFDHSLGKRQEVAHGPRSGVGGLQIAMGCLHGFSLQDVDRTSRILRERGGRLRPEEEGCHREDSRLESEAPRHPQEDHEDRTRAWLRRCRRSGNGRGRAHGRKGGQCGACPPSDHEDSDVYSSKGAQGVHRGQSKTEISFCTTWWRHGRRRLPDCRAPSRRKQRRHRGVSSSNPPRVNRGCCGFCWTMAKGVRSIGSSGVYVGCRLWSQLKWMAVFPQTPSNLKTLWSQGGFGYEVVKWTSCMAAKDQLIPRLQVSLEGSDGSFVAQVFPSVSECPCRVLWSYPRMACECGCYCMSIQTGARCRSIEFPCPWPLVQLFGLISTSIYDEKKSANDTDEEDNSASGTPTSDWNKSTCPVPFMVLRPNQDLTVDFDDIVPTARGNIIPPPEWRNNPIYRTAVSAGVAVRDGGRLVVSFRSWLVVHGEARERSHRDFSMRPQLLVHLPETARKVWRDRVSRTVHVWVHMVRPTPMNDPADPPHHRFVHLILEVQRPVLCWHQPTLIASREITADGVSPPVWFPTLLPNQFNAQDVWEEIQRPCAQHQLLVPMAGGVRRWLNPYHTRDSVPGLFLPTWHDRRLPLISEQPYDDGQSLLQISASSLDFYVYPPVSEEEDEADALYLMQRSASRTPRRDVQDSVSTESIVIAHTYLPSRSHRLLTLDRSQTLSYAAQIEASWQFPPHTNIVELHEVLFPPSDLEGSSDVVFLLETTTCRTRQAVPDDQLVLADIVLEGARDTTDQSHIRRVLWSRRFATRDATLHLLSSHMFCASSLVNCVLSVNRVVWAERDSAVREIRHGDAIQLWIRGPRTMSLKYMLHLRSKKEQILKGISTAHHPMTSDLMLLLCRGPMSLTAGAPLRRNILIQALLRLALLGPSPAGTCLYQHWR